MRIPLSRPDIGEREIEQVTRVLRSGQLSLGPLLHEFEEKFSSYAGTKYAVATNSGTSALHLAALALGIGPGDEVLTASFSFVASANCILHANAQPLFADIDPATLNLDPRALREVIQRDYAWVQGNECMVNRKTGGTLKAILPVHVFGLPCEMETILEIADEFNLKVLEDVCESLGAEYAGRRVGTFGDAAAFAFYPNKQMTTAEGGMIVTDDPEVAAACRSLRNQGRDEFSGWLKHDRLGYNFRLSELHCALGLAQLERIDELLAARALVASDYARHLVGIPEIRLLDDYPRAIRSWFVYVIRTQGQEAPALRNLLIEGLRARGIACQAYFPAIHRQPYFREYLSSSQGPLPHTEFAADRTLALPFFSTMTSEEIEQVCAAVREIVAESRKHLATKEEHSFAARGGSGD